MLLVFSGCQWLNPRSSGQDWDLTSSQRDSLEIYFRDYRQLAQENERLKAQNE
jgi:hypothetical protein